MWNRQDSGESRPSVFPCVPHEEMPWGPMGLMVRICLQYSLPCRKWQLYRVLERKLLCSKALSAEHRRTFCTSSPAVINIPKKWGKTLETTEDLPINLNVRFATTGR
jgi:hypothetical protein